MHLFWVAQVTELGLLPPWPWKGPARGWAGWSGSAFKWGLDEQMPGGRITLTGSLSAQWDDISSPYSPCHSFYFGSSCGPMSTPSAVYRVVRTAPTTAGAAAPCLLLFKAYGGKTHCLQEGQMVDISQITSLPGQDPPVAFQVTPCKWQSSHWPTKP